MNQIQKYNGGITALAERVTSGDLQLAIRLYGASLGIPDYDMGNQSAVGAVRRAMVLSEQFGYLPGVHIVVMPFNKKSDKPTTYTVIDTYAQALHNLNEHNRIHKKRCHVFTRTATVDEVKTNYAAMEYEYDERDPAKMATLIDPDQLDELQKLVEIYGNEFAPSPKWSFGTYLYRAVKKDRGNGYWPERLPNADTPERVATRRAEKLAIKAAIPQYPVVSSDPLQHVANHLEEVKSEGEQAPLPGEGMPRPGSNRMVNDQSGMPSMAASVARPYVVVEPPVEQTLDDEVDFREEEADGPISTAELATLVVSTVDEWGGPADAKEWAIREGFCDNQPHADQSWANSIEEAGGYSKNKQRQIMELFAHKHLERRHAP